MSDTQIGVGTELHVIFYELGIHPRKECQCQRMMKQMNAWGIEGCKGEHRQEIVDWLREQQKTRNWAQTLRDIAAGTWAVMKRELPLWINPADPAPGLLGEAIRRAERKVAIIQRNGAESS